MLTLAWFWVSTFAALMPTPAQIMSLPGQLLEAQRSDETAQPPLMLGWIKDTETPFS